MRSCYIMTHSNPNFDKMNNLHKQIQILMQILTEIQDQGFLRSSIEFELADNNFVDLLDAINDIPKKEITQLIINKIDFLHSQLRNFINEYSN